jgi:endonuclease/exonuclease/phosphatase family metal-dependent hydrolase
VKRVPSAIAFLVATLAIALLGDGVGVAVSADCEHRVQVLTFNVLAPIWAGAVWYPADMDVSLLNREYRRARTGVLLRSVRDQFDIVCLQEVNEVELPYYLEALGPEFEGAMAFNDATFWSDWLVPEVPWEPNGTAVIVRKARFASRHYDDVPVSNDGNHASVFEGRHRASGLTVRVQSVHLDSDSNANRIEELRALLLRYPGHPGIVDVICGDMNEDTVSGSAAGILRRGAYLDVLASIGNREATHPWSTSYYSSVRWAVIDHVLVRNALPVAGDVMDFGLWSIADETDRIEENLRLTGSDHFPVAATVAW